MQHTPRPNEQKFTETERRNGDWNHSQFVDALMQASGSGFFEPAEMPSSIDLTGKTSAVSEQLLRMMNKDARRREHARVVYYSPHKASLFLGEGVTIGTEDQVALQLSVNAVLKAGQEEQYKRIESVAMLIHTHPSNSVPSPLDMTTLLRDEHELPCESSLIVCDNLRYLFCRTILTLVLTAQQRETFIRSYDTTFELIASTRSKSEVLHHAEKLIIKIAARHGLAFYKAENSWNFTRLHDGSIQTES